jgi:hypothetical protein
MSITCFVFVKKTSGDMVGGYKVVVGAALQTFGVGIRV